MEEISSPVFFGEWLKHRRKALDLTQAELAQRAGCSLPALRKIETGERRPSKQLAGLLANSLEIALEERNVFIRVARGELGMERLSIPTRLSPGVPRPAQKTAHSPGNLPGILTPFIGREPELAALSQLLRDSNCRLITLVGSGGIGKTRLAVETANQHKDLFPDGIWFVPLEALDSPVFLVQAIADALNFKFQDPARPLQQLLNHLFEKRALLILDNIEHLVEGAGVFATILESVPSVKLMVTSRERLNLLSEWVFEIQGLPLPPSDRAETFEAYSSVALFLQSAKRIQAGFEISGDDRQWVLRICKIMEGMPLGIELAAAWVGLLSCEEIAKEIESNLDFLTVTMRDLPERHRSMRATLDHSWKLLNAEEKLILSRLSAFQGSFRREDAKEICGASLTVLSSLNNKMLLRRTDPVHYALHELIRQYAGLKLAEDVNESERIKDQHSLYFAQRLSEWEKALKGSLQVETLNEMAQKIDNLRQGWQRMVCACQDYPFKKNRFSPELFHSSLFSLSLFYETRFRYWEAIDVFTESMECLKSAQSTFEQDGDRSYFCAILGQVMAYLGLHHSYILQYQQAHAYLNEAIRLLQNDQTRVERAQAQVILARIYSDQGQLHKSAALLEQARDIFQQEGDTWWYLKTLLNLAWINLLTGKIQEGKSLYQECSRLVNPNDLRLGLLLRNGSAYARYLQNDFAGAEQLLHENLQQSYQLGFKRQTALTYLDLGQVALDTNRIELAEDYFQESVDLFSEYGNFHNLAALGLLYSGKCLMIRQEIEAARENFLQVIKIGQTLDTSYLVYWGLVNLARTYMIRGKTEKALKMALVLLQYPVEYKKAHDDGVRLIADLQAMLPPWQIEDAMDQAEGKGIETLLDLIEKS